MSVTFAELCDALDRAGAVVGVAVEGGRHVLAVGDPRRGRSIRLPVDRGFDRAAATLVASVALRELLAAPDLRSRDRVCCGRWPELAALARRQIPPVGSAP